VSVLRNRDAIMKLPPAVTLAFTPYGADPSKLAERARKRHEIRCRSRWSRSIIRQRSRPQTLLTTLAPEQNIDRLYWHLSRIQGYAGSPPHGRAFRGTDAVMQLTSARRPSAASLSR
jgi:polysaccharide deacetylase 2 family uncharacterized protein YibQ